MPRVVIHFDAAELAARKINRDPNKPLEIQSFTFIGKETKVSEESGHQEDYLCIKVPPPFVNIIVLWATVLAVGIGPTIE